MNNTLSIDIISPYDPMEPIFGSLCVGDNKPFRIVMGAAAYKALTQAGFFVEIGDSMDTEGRWNRSRTYIPASSVAKPQLTDQHREELKLLLKAQLLLHLAIETINYWHGLYQAADEAARWDTYQSSPEMKRLNAGMELLKGRNDEVGAIVNRTLATAIN